MKMRLNIKMNDLSTLIRNGGLNECSMDFQEKFRKAMYEHEPLRVGCGLFDAGSSYSGIVLAVSESSVVVVWDYWSDGKPDSHVPRFQSHTFELPIPEYIKRKEDDYTEAIREEWGVDKPPPFDWESV